MSKSLAEEIAKKVTESNDYWREFGAKHANEKDILKVVQRVLDTHEPVGYKTTNEQGLTYTVFEEEMSGKEYLDGLMRCKRLNRQIIYLYASPQPSTEVVGILKELNIVRDDYKYLLDNSNGIRGCASYKKISEILNRLESSK